MTARGSSGPLFVAVAALILAAGFGATAEGRKVRLFILSGQSNMACLDPNVSFTPAVQKAFAEEEVIVVKSAQGGQPIHRWVKGWKAPEGVKSKIKPGEPSGDLYDVLLKAVRKATDGKPLDSVAFVWMQGEADAKRGLAPIYEESLRSLLRQLRDDLKSPGMAVVIGRLSDHNNGDAGWDAVRTIQQKIASEDARGAWVDTDDLNGPQNALHYDNEGYVELGRRFAAKAIELVHKR